MSDETEDWKERWKVIIKCRDCELALECIKPSVSLQRVEGFNRMVVIGAPEVCPSCKNLKVLG